MSSDVHPERSLWAWTFSLISPSKRHLRVFCSLSRVRLYQAAVQTSGEQPERGGGGQTSAAPGVSRAAAQRRRTR